MATLLCAKVSAVAWSRCDFEQYGLDPSYNSAFDLIYMMHILYAIFTLFLCQREKGLVMFVPVIVLLLEQRVPVLKNNYHNDMVGFQ